ncbi:MAG: 6-phosphogluconolactonase [Spirochaetales bacterium]|uniref:6-phosphogluconolactonase n=1 Tax=Candidatus Thalassospirochaeta sargassi TaxID=3119039 RepID=A0AAJ1MIQ3_9SPIO|nr:6-phosphogluconolactonase [Spirochaetales bacterium]
MINLKLFDDVDAIASYTYELLTAAGMGAGNPAAALSFGSTYNAVFSRWAKLHAEAGTRTPQLPALFPADERLVDISHDGSNWGTARKLFIDECGNSADREHWASDAAAYNRMLQEHFSEQTAGKNDETPQLPVFDLIFLGMGPDGHTASLFPGSCPQPHDIEWNSTVLETTAPFNPPNRLTLGPEVIASAGKLVMTVTGAGKAGIFRRLLDELNGKPGAELLPPARIILRRSELELKTEIICDKDAASEMEI